MTRVNSIWRQSFKVFCIFTLATSLSGNLLIAGEVNDIVPMVSLLLRSESSGEPTWGADSVGSQYRPDKSWLSGFEFPAKTVTVGTTIEDAMASCPEEGYCLIQLDKSISLLHTVFIERSKTKILGIAGNKVRFSNAGGGIFLEIASDTEEIVIENLDLDGESHDYKDKTIFAIYVSGENIDKIAIQGNTIHHIYSNEDAHGIAMYGEGDTESGAIKNVIINNNHVYNMRTGSSESIAVNGNVTNWEITRNTVAQVNNIAIVAIGGEGTVAPQLVGGRVLPHTLDAARYGFIENNSVTGMTTVTNPAYDSEHSWAGAIYVDGGHHLYIAGNSVTDTEWAYDIGAENCVTPKHITLENNTALGSYYGDFLVGGYAGIGYKEDSKQGRAINCDPTVSIDDNEGHGYVENVTVRNNIFNSPAGNASQDFVNTIELSYRIRQAIILQPGVVADHPDGVVSGDDNSIRVSGTN